MMGENNPQPSIFYNINLEQFVAADHPFRKIRPLIDVERIREICKPLYSETGRPSIPPEQLFLALLVGRHQRRKEALIWWMVITRRTEENGSRQWEANERENLTR